MKKQRHPLRRGVLGLACAAVLAGVAFSAMVQQRAHAQTAVATPDPSLSANADPMILHGAYLARAGDCIACHTAKGGAPFAGGLGLKTPFGTIYATNITPDKTHGIGNYTYDDFARALREGVAADGHRLYPAMPYPSFSKINDADMHALYAYFMQGVKPSPTANKDNGLKFPYNIRALMFGWNLLFRPSSIYEPDPKQSAEWNRGAYLVQGLEHCSACHTPHGAFGQEAAFDDKGNTSFLSGYNLENWHAPNLRGDAPNGLGNWTDADIAAFLKSGRNDHTAAFGAMSEAVADSTQYLSDEDLHAIAVYLKALPPKSGGTTVNGNTSAPATSGASAASGTAVASAVSGASMSASASESVTASNAEQVPPLRAGQINSAGARVYLNSCNACHRSDGTGAKRIFPALAGNSAVAADDPTSLIHLVLSGSRMPSTATAPAPLAMPDFGWRLSNQQIADVLTFVRGSWGNHAAAVTVDQVAKVREAVRQTEAASN